MVREFSVSTDRRAQGVDITARLSGVVSDVQPSGGVNVWIPHTTAGLTVNESADPNVMDDLIGRLASLVPWDGDYDHIEDNAAAHIKTILTDTHHWLPVLDGRLNLGRWQGVFLLEWDGPRQRTVQVYPD